MTPQQAYRNVKGGTTFLKMEKDFFRWLKKNKTKELLAMQNKQLFNDSQGADGIKLGNYSGLGKKKGTGPFTMQDTGQLKSKMSVVVLSSRLEIEFRNTRKGIGKYSDTNLLTNFRQDDIFGTADWFGLTPEHTQILNRWANEYAVAWTLSKFYYGVGTKLESAVGK